MIFYLKEVTRTQEGIHQRRNMHQRLAIRLQHHHTAHHLLTTLRHTVLRHHTISLRTDRVLIRQWGLVIHHRTRLCRIRWLLILLRTELAPELLLPMLPVLTILSLTRRAKSVNIYQLLIESLNRAR